MKKEKQVTYFEAMYQGGIAQHYTEDTKDFENWMGLFKKFDKDSKATYIAYSDGTTEGTPVGYTKI